MPLPHGVSPKRAGIIGIVVLLILTYVAAGCSRTMTTAFEGRTDKFIPSKELAKVARLIGVDKRQATIGGFDVRVRAGEVEVFELGLLAPRNGRYAEYAGATGRGRTLYIRQTRITREVVGRITIAEFISATGELSLSDLATGLATRNINVELGEANTGEYLPDYDKQKVFRLQQGAITKLGNVESRIMKERTPKLTVRDNVSQNVFLIESPFPRSR